jgi:hypothetical protein
MKQFAQTAWRRVPDRAWPKTRIEAWRRTRSFSPLEPNPPDPEKLETFLFYAVISAYAEGDVIASTVANAFTQGCDRVFLIDNASPDDTVERATSAGAENVIDFATAEYDEVLRWTLVNAWIDHASKASGADHIWWLLLDADEFPEAPGHLRLRDLLASLDRRFRVVGARFLNHFPTTPPYHEPGRHPLDFQELAVEKARPALCHLAHNKHSLIRWDRSGDRIGVSFGWHTLQEPTKFVEPDLSFVIHHIPFRRRSDMEARHELLATGRASREPAGSELLMRLNQLETVYAKRWSEYNVGEHYGGVEKIGYDPVPWWTIVGRERDDVARWYAR